MEQEKNNVSLDTLGNQEAGRWVSIVRIQMKRTDKGLCGVGALNSPAAVKDMVQPIFDMSDREVFAVLSLDAKLLPVAFEVVAVGGIDRCIVDVPNIFKHAILSNASHVLCIHNHPSGDPTPSTEDLQITKRIKLVGDLLGISLIDHIVLGGDTYYSFKELGDLKFKNQESEAA